MEIVIISAVLMFLFVIGILVVCICKHLEREGNYNYLFRCDLNVLGYNTVNVEKYNKDIDDLYKFNKKNNRNKLIVFIIAISIMVFFCLFQALDNEIFIIICFLLLALGTYFGNNIFLYDIDISFKYENLVIKIINEQLEEYNFSLCTLSLTEEEQIIKEFYEELKKNIVIEKIIELSKEDKKEFLYKVFEKIEDNNGSQQYYKGLCSIINKNSIDKNKKYVIRTKENVEEENEFLFSNIEEDIEDVAYVDRYVNRYLNFENFFDLINIDYINEDFKEVLLEFKKNCNINFEIHINENSIIFMFLYNPFVSRIFFDSSNYREELYKECYVLDHIAKLVYEVSNLDEI